MSRGNRAKAAIVEAALAGVQEKGWDALSMHDVRVRAGVSNGSLFHHFPTRRELEAAVLAAGMASHQEAVLEVLTSARGPRQGVRNVVLRHLRWIDENREVARLLLCGAPAELQAALDQPALETSRSFFDRVGSWLGRQGWTGRPDLMTMNALWLGAANELARGALSLGQRPPVGSQADVVADAAWRALAPHLGEEKR